MHRNGKGHLLNMEPLANDALVIPVWNPRNTWMWGQIILDWGKYTICNWKNAWVEKTLD